MELRTVVKINPSPNRITYNDPVMFIGSCFAASIGHRMETGHMPVMINPSGTVYNPVSVCNTLDTITSGRNYMASDLYEHKNTWLSFNHYTDFSSENAEAVLEKINRRSEAAGDFLTGARFLFVTFGTARVYRWKHSGKIVSNCHKIPSSEFTNELLSVEAIVSLWNNQLERLKSLFPDLKVIFTVSPVRHWKDGAHGNQISKSVLLLAVEELLGHPSKPEYFPAYEIVMDDLRDYRFYDDDMLHPSTAAVDYIWNSFSDCYLDINIKKLWQEVSSITKAMSHKILTTSKTEVTRFAKNILTRIDAVESRQPVINLGLERSYFSALLKF
ncbi:MAG: GSCFA domain-containing protein [Bacteroidia bacterium]|nr:GSCFA domain-containing protein [Bacteroidia bacterium]